VAKELAHKATVPVHPGNSLAVREVASWLVLLTKARRSLSYFELNNKSKGESLRGLLKSSDGHLSKFRDTDIHNSNATAHREQLPQHLLEPIHKLDHAGRITRSDQVRHRTQAQGGPQVQAKDPSQEVRLTESIREESKKYRCVLFNRL
jgi:hypothetical protein